jgi:hypothetical protein
MFSLHVHFTVYVEFRSVVQGQIVRRYYVLIKNK